MEWTSEHDKTLVREILTVEPYLFKPSTLKRGQAWTQIADILCSIPNPVFRVNQRSVRERYKFLEKAFVRKNANEEKSTGTNDPELTEVEKGVEEIVQKGKEAALHYDDETQNVENERKKAQDVREMCLETFSETRKRTDSTDSEESPRIKKRGTGSETIAFLQAKAEKDGEIRTKELEVRKLEIDQRTKAAEDQQKVLVDLLTMQKKQIDDMMHQQQTTQQQQNALFLAQQQAQQQQMQLFVKMMDNFKKD